MKYFSVYSDERCTRKKAQKHRTGTGTDTVRDWNFILIVLNLVYPRARRTLVPTLPSVSFPPFDPVTHLASGSQAAIEMYLRQH